MAIANQSDINDFLFKFKFFAQDYACFSFIERDKNMQSLAELGISITQAITTMLQLTYKDYSCGPDPDHKYPEHNIWIFGSKIDSEDIYIKLSDNFKCNIAKCISFHKADSVIIYPYRGA